MLLRLLLLLGLVLPLLVQAAPWAKTGDVRLRTSLEWLADRGCLDAPVTTWPVMWADIRLSANAGDACSMSSAWHYVRFEKRWAFNRATAQLSLSGSGQSPAFHSFAAQPREKEVARLQLEGHTDHFAAGLSPAFVPEPYRENRPARYKRFRWGGTYAAASFGNWVVGLGALNRWWGPGKTSSLILSNNARPVPALFLQRRHAEALHWPLLKWLGPWTMTIFAGQLESNRQVPHTKLLGMRVAFKPVSWLEIGASRTAQWGGQGRPQTWHSFGNMLGGHDNYHGNKKDEPGNQLGGFDVRVGLPLGETTTVNFYGQQMGEDQAGRYPPMPSRNVYLFGTGASGNWFSGRQAVWVEYTNTLVDDFKSSRRPNTTYEHSIYHNGYRYHGRVIGSTWESDSRVVSLGLKQFFADGRSLGLTINHAKVNKDGKLGGSSHYSPLPWVAVPGGEALTIYQLDWRQLLFNGRVTLSASYMSQPLRTLTRKYDRTTIMATWEFRFDI